MSKSSQRLTTAVRVFPQAGCSELLFFFFLTEINNPGLSSVCCSQDVQLYVPMESMRDVERVKNALEREGNDWSTICPAKVACMSY
jgi:hypothetical protein